MTAGPPTDRQAGLSHLDLKQLRRFLTIVKRGSLAAAAPETGLTQQALGAGIARLEEALGVQLFDRVPGGVTALTACGTMFVRHARQILAAADRAQEELLAYRDARAGSVSIGIGEAFAHEVIADCVRECHRSRPDIRIAIIEDYSEALREKLIEGEIDFIAGADTAAAGDALDYFPLYLAHDIVIARAAHPLAQRPRLKLRDLRGYTWMAPRSRPLDAAIIGEAFRSEDLDPPTRFIWTDAQNVGMDLLLSDDLLIMVSPAQVTGMLRTGRVVALNIKVPTVERRVGLSFRRHAELPPAVLMIMEDIRRKVHVHIKELSYASPVNMEGRISLEA